MDGFGSVLQASLVFIICTLTFVYVYLQRINNYWKDRGIPYEKPSLLLGNLTFLMRRSFWDFFYEVKLKHPREYVGVFLAWQPALVVQTPALAKQIIVKDSHYFQNRYCYSSYEMDPIGSLNLFTLRNPTWTTMRAELTPIFTSKQLKLLTELMNINAVQLVQRIQKYHIDQNAPVNLKELFSMYTSDTVAYTVFGIRLSVLSGQDSPLWHITSHMVQWTVSRGFEFIMIFFVPIIAKLLRLKFFSQAGTDYVKKIFWDIVDSRKGVGKSNNKDLVNHLLQLRDNMRLPGDEGTQYADDMMLAQAAVFILGAIETSSTTMSYCLHELAHHPEAQEKLYEEIDEALKQSEKEMLDYRELLELKYLTSCINETLRKYPPSPHLDRVCNQTYKLNEDVTIEKGVPVFVNVLALHYNEDFFPQPEEWRPERMTSTENDNMNFTFLPFGDGPRFCIGKRYGMMQVRAGIAQIIHKFRIEPDASEPYIVRADPLSVLLAPKSGGRVKFVKR